MTSTRCGKRRRETADPHSVLTECRERLENRSVDFSKSAEWVIPKRRRDDADTISKRIVFRLIAAEVYWARDTWGHFEKDDFLQRMKEVYPELHQDVAAEYEFWYQSGRTSAMISEKCSPGMIAASCVEIGGDSRYRMVPVDPSRKAHGTFFSDLSKLGGLANDFKAIEQNLQQRISTTYGKLKNEDPDGLKKRDRHSQLIDLTSESDTSHAEQRQNTPSRYPDGLYTYYQAATGPLVAPSNSTTGSIGWDAQPLNTTNVHANKVGHRLHQQIGVRGGMAEAFSQQLSRQPSPQATTPNTQSPLVAAPGAQHQPLYPQPSPPDAPELNVQSTQPSWAQTQARLYAGDRAFKFDYDTSHSRVQGCLDGPWATTCDDLERIAGSARPSELEMERAIGLALRQGKCDTSFARDRGGTTPASGKMAVDMSQVLRDDRYNNTVAVGNFWRDTHLQFSGIMSGGGIGNTAALGTERDRGVSLCPIADTDPCAGSCAANKFQQMKMDQVWV
ncbi:hypothetical protein CKAH01_16389 [Colletotrichum kahawae]|uniref:Uncharacterized protein n=1 Tax=Colletotrichum kahawae TaxID=34407 RepID=A0AAD9YDH6_COLKA|nr:hypothetical protein CKAH01_16389 [Colletotrichum kahawae]